MQGLGTLLLISVVHQVHHTDDLPGVIAVDEEYSRVLGLHHLADRVDDEPDLFDLVFRGLIRVYVRDVDDRLLVEVEDFADCVGVPTLVEVVADAERLEVFVPVQLIVVVERDRGEFRLVLG